MPPKKRTAAEAASIPQTSRRRSGRIGLSGKKSTYFEAADDDGSDELSTVMPPRKAAKTQATPKRGKKAASDDDELLYEDEKSESEIDSGDDGDGYVEDKEESDDDNSESEGSLPPVAQKRGRGRPAKTPTPTKATAKKSAAKPRVSDAGAAKGRGRPKAQGKAVAKAKAKTKSEESDAEEDDDDDDDDDDEEENLITFIPAVKLRDLDGVDYEDERLHKNTFLFLKDLKANNNRKWLKANDKEYRRSLKDWESFVETLTEKIIEADDTIPELPIKDVVFRIYRDVRFSKDQTPYKPHYSAAWSRTGRKGPYACYYVHAEPGRCIIGGGIWHPDAEALALLRASVDERPHRIRRVLMNPTFRKTFLPEAKANEKSVLAAFAAKNQENALKKKPKGFHPEHRDIELLKLRNYTIGTEIEEADFTTDDAQEKIMRVISAMVEFVSFLNSVVKPDPNVDSDSDEAGE
ncbi:uncharacterized protein GGS22DRAFT_93754 [Annulohypoxylon maeteangense]|uniref:uncharacterized protein n=1 Tax=Annulohypoxylon maeteangense TaxID=1927788 RepID=UPI0020081B4A|nr:uncharacterized protein GGS22DRAFT_93754 [Annulohypoxylon maeteangense]KAI0888145.1 hypothetical protein GGS22DRAFT_93754 [Annulohypoxylon maeteangense]